MEKLHHQIRLRILSCNRMSENHREPEVPEEEVPAGRTSRWPCKYYLKGTCHNSFCEKWHLQNACTTRPRVVVGFGEMCSFALRQVDEQPTKRSKKNDDKSAVAMLKKGNWQERICLRCLSRSNGETCEKK